MVEHSAHFAEVGFHASDPFKTSDMIPPHNPATALAARLDPAGKPGMLAGLRVVELADETAEYVGLVLAGLGAEVIKVEPPGGSPTRAIGPFVGDVPGPERSLHFMEIGRAHV